MAEIKLKNMRVEDLDAIYDSRKSFYGKAKILKTSKVIELFSYDALVASYNWVTKILWITEELAYHTMTTNRHIREFQKQIENGDL